MIWHPLDGNMIAADTHYNQPDRQDFDSCASCLRPFAETSAELDDDTVMQSDTHWHLCISCEDE